MDAPTFLLSTGALIAGGTAGSSGLSHLVHFSRLREDLARQRVGSEEAERPVLAVALTGAELVCGLTALVVVLAGGASDFARVTFLTLGGLYLLFAVGSWRLLRTRPGVPCGCSSTGLPVSGWVTLRAAILAGIALSCGLAPSTIAEMPSAGAEFFVAGFAALALGTLWWSLPAAMHDPTPRARSSPTLLHLHDIRRFPA